MHENPEIGSRLTPEEVERDSPAYQRYLRTIYPESSPVYRYRLGGLKRAAMTATELLAASTPDARTFLEVGCGDGSLPIVMAKHGLASVGVDVSPEPLRTARDRAEDLGLAVRWHTASIYDLPYPNGSFDIVACNDVLEHVEDVHTALGELARVLSPTGTLFANVTNRFSLLNIAIEPHSRLFGVILLPHAWAAPLVRWIRKKEFDVYSPLGFGAFLRALDGAHLEPVSVRPVGMARRLAEPELILNPVARTGTLVAKRLGAAGWLEQLFETSAYRWLIAPTHSCVARHARREGSG